MPQVRRVLDAEVVPTLTAYLDAGGGGALDAAARLGPAATIDEVMASGLRGRGGAGFPTGVKWRTVAEMAAGRPRPVVVNAAEGEPGSFKDRAILRTNPYRVVEGAVVAARTMAAPRLVLALKASFEREVALLRAAVDEVAAAGWLDGIEVDVFEGPSEYLFGEETALCEVIDGGYPFPRLAPPFRSGIGDDIATPELEGPPTLVNNVETMANVALVLARGADWFREVGTADSPGTVVCTVSGATTDHAVGEFAMGTPLREVIDELGGGPRNAPVVAAVSGVANPILAGDELDAPLSYEGMAARGSGLGAAGFLVLDGATDPVAFAAGVSRFLAVESCGQCLPCKDDGLAISTILDRLVANQPAGTDLEELELRLSTITDGARCYLAQQHQFVVQSLLDKFADAVVAHVDGRAAAGERAPVAAVADLAGTEVALDERQLTKQPDWTWDEPWSGKHPAQRLDETGADTP
jgi:NADH:ubiquinone oxidoreductase subunit F (NADH-binding)